MDPSQSMNVSKTLASVFAHSMQRVSLYVRTRCSKREELEIPWCLTDAPSGTSNCLRASFRSAFSGMCRVTFLRTKHSEVQQRNDIVDIVDMLNFLSLYDVAPECPCERIVNSL